MSSLNSEVLIIENLLEATSDKNEKVRSAIYKSLRKIAQRYPSEVISSANNYRRRNPKLSNQEIRNLFELMKSVFESKLSDVDFSLVDQIIDCAIDESLKAAKIPFISADLLPVIGVKYCDEVYLRLRKYMPEGIAPHASVIYTLGSLSIVNMQSFLPFITNVFNYLLSILSVTKTDSMRKLYATTANQLAETVFEQISEDKSTVTKELYSASVEEMFETFVTIWLMQIKDINVCEVITQAAGAMILLFSNQKLMNDASYIVNTFLTLYKKIPTIPRFIITQGLSNFLSVVPRAALQPSLDVLLSSFHSMVFVVPDFTQPLTVKNHNEVLRCYDHLGVLFEEKLCEVLLNNLRSVNEQDRVVGLIVLSHLLNTSELILKSRVTELVSLLHSLVVSNSSTKVDKSLVKIISALAYRGYLSEKDSVFIEFLGRHCHHNCSSNAEIQDLESMCRSTVFLLSTTMISVQSLCWKVLMQMLMNGEHLSAVSVFAKSLAYLIANCDTSVLEKNCYDRSEVVFVRVVSLLGCPLQDNRGVYLLNFLNDYILWKVKVDTIIWKPKLSELISYLENSVWNDTEWDKKLFSVFTASFTDDTKPWLEAVNIETVRLLTEYQSNLEQNHNSNSNNVIIDERAMMYKLLAFLTQYMDDATVINNNISKILTPISQRTLMDLKACSQSVGILSKSNFNDVFKELEKFQKDQLTKKTTKFLGFLKDTKCETEIEVVRRMICDCFSAILFETPSRVLLPKLKGMLKWLIYLIQNAKDVQTINSCTEALFRVSEVLLRNEDCFDEVDECRKELFTFLLNGVEVEKSMPNVTYLKTINTLFKLASSTLITEKLQLLQKCLNKMFQYYSVSSSTAAISECGVIGTDPVIQQLCILIANTVDTKNSKALDETVSFLQPWLSHRIINHRIISLFLLKAALNSYVHCYFNDTKNCVKFGSVGSLLGRLYIRTFENNTELSKLACECVILLFAITEASVDNINTTEEDLQKSLLNVDRLNVDFFRVSTCSKLSSEQLQSFTENLLNGLMDTEKSCALETARLLTLLFTEIGSQFHRQALDIFNNLLLKLVKIENEEVCNLTVEAILALARHTEEMFVSIMLNQPLPFHQNICSCLSKILEDEVFADEIFKKLIETVRWNPLPDESSKDKHKSVNIRPLVAVSAIKEILSPNNATEFTSKHFVELFPSVLMLIPVYMGEMVHSNNGINKINREAIASFVPARSIFDTLLIIMERAQCSDVGPVLSSFTEKIEFRKSERKPVYFEMIKILTRNISRFSCEFVVKVLESLSSFTGSDKPEGQRATAVIIFVEIFSLKCCEDAVLVDTLILNLLKFLNDSSPFVREHSLKGLADISNLEFSLVERYKERILSALMTGLEDSEANTQVGIIVQSLTGLLKLLPFLSNDQYASVFITIAVRIKPFFEKEDVEVRQLSLRLFGELASIPVVEQSSFNEQINHNMLCLLFHLGEKEQVVNEACKFSLKAISSLLKSEHLSSVIAKNLTDNKFNYQEYLTEVTKALCTEFATLSFVYISIAISYTKSSWPEIRANAALFIGLMYYYQDEEYLENISIDTLSNRLLILLKDFNSNVRSSAASSLGYLLQAKAVPFSVNKV